MSKLITIVDASLHGLFNDEERTLKVTQEELNDLLDSSLNIGFHTFSGDFYTDDFTEVVNFIDKLRSDRAVDTTIRDVLEKN